MTDQYLLSTQNGSGIELHELALTFFQNMDFEIQEQVTLIGVSGKKYQFDMLISSDTILEINEVVVEIIDWNRTVGVNKLIRFERIIKDLNPRKGMVISNDFSDSAEKFAKRHGLIIYERQHFQIVND